MPTQIPQELLRTVQQRCPELLSVLVSLWSQGHIGADARTFSPEELRWLSTLFKDLVIHENPESSLPRNPESTLVIGASASGNLVDLYSPAHLVQFPLSNLEFRKNAEDVLAMVTSHSPQLELNFAMGPKLKVSALTEPKPALFLDRDGTIIELVPYITDPALVALKPGIVAIIQWARSNDMMVICVTNQSGIGRGWYTWEQFDAIQSRMDELLAAEGVNVDATFAAGYFSEAEFAEGHVAPGLRKPAPGMLTWAAQSLNLVLSKSVMIGDSSVDVEAGQRAGCAQVHRITPQFDLPEILRFLQKKYP
jgi:histidinol-phosphate phosphatase family protein